MRTAPNSPYFYTGFGMLWGVQLTLLFSRSLFSSSVTRGADGFNYALGLGIACACLAVFAIARKGLLADQTNRAPAILAIAYGVSLSIGVALLPLCSLTGAESLRLFSGFICGLGLGAGYVAWMLLYSSHLRENTLKVLIASLSIGLALFAALAWMYPGVRTVLLCVSSAASSLCCLMAAKRPNPPEEESAIDPRVAKLDNNMMCVAVFGIATSYGISGNISLNSTSALQANTILWHLSLAGIAVFLLALLGRLLPRQTNATLLFRFVFPLVIISLALLPFCGPIYLDLYNFVIAEAYQLMEVTLFFSFATMTLGRIRFEAICLPLAVMWLGTTLGVFAGSFVFGTDLAWSTKLTVLAMAEFFLLSMMLYALSFLMERRASASYRVSSLDAPPALAAQGGDGSMRDACSKLCERYGLTNREGEILLLLARGRSAVFIAEKLYLSPNTVKSYMRAMYSKMDVHSKQELLDAVERESL